MHTMFGVLLSMHEWVRTVSRFFVVTLMLVHVVLKKNL